MATNKQKALAKEILRNPTQTMGQAMAKAGYDPVTRPVEVTSSKGWQELVDTMLPDEKLLLRHYEGLDATKIMTSHTEPDREVPDYAVRKQYVELGYKVKGRLKENESKNLTQINVEKGNTIAFVNFKNDAEG